MKINILKYIGFAGIMLVIYSCGSNNTANAINSSNDTSKVIVPKENLDPMTKYHPKDPYASTAPHVNLANDSMVIDFLWHHQLNNFMHNEDISNATTNRLTMCFDNRKDSVTHGVKTWFSGAAGRGGIIVLGEKKYDNSRIVHFISFEKNPDNPHKKMDAILFGDGLLIVKATELKEYLGEGCPIIVQEKKPYWSFDSYHATIL